MVHGAPEEVVCKGAEEVNLSREIFRDPRILLWIAVVALSLFSIGFFGVKLGLDVQGGTYLQLQLQGAIAQVDVDASKVLEVQFNATSIQQQGSNYIVIINGRIPPDLPDSLGYPGSKVAARGNTTQVTINALPEDVITNYLKKSLDADVRIIPASDPILYEIRTNVTRDSLNEVLAPVGGSIPATSNAFTYGVLPATVAETKSVLDSKLNRIGMKDIKVRPVGNQFIIVDMAGVDINTARDIVGQPGKFEIRIQIAENQTEHVLYGDSIESVDIPRASGTNQMWGVPFTLSPAGAKILQKAAIDSGATKDPTSHELSMYLDKDQIFSAPLAPELASSLQKVPSSSMVAEVGSGDAGSKKAMELYIHLKEGALPVNVKVVGSGQVAAALGKQFLFQMELAGLFALLAVAGMVYYRYRDRRIALPMVMTSFSEVVMLLGIWGALGSQFDLASLAGIITVIGTGVDQLIIITDEVIGGEASAVVAAARSAKKTSEAAAEKTGIIGRITGPSSKVYLSRLSRAFVIILASSATSAVAMLPLLYMGFGALTGFALIIIAGVFVGVLIARPAYGRIIGYILSEARVAGPVPVAVANHGRQDEVAATKKEAAEEEDSAKKAAKFKRKKGGRKDTQGNSEE
jgi:preprotein translocase subunit SecD